MLLRSSSTASSSGSSGGSGPSKSRRPHPYKSLLRYARSMDDASTLATATISILCSSTSPPPVPAQPPLGVPNRRSSVRAVSMPQALHSLQNVARTRALEHNRADSAAALRMTDELRVRHAWAQHVLATAPGAPRGAIEGELREELRKFETELKVFFLGGEESDQCFVYDRALCGYVPELRRLEKVCGRFSTWGERLRRRVGIGGGRGEEVKSR
ncbi:hypothetical protein EDC01DRAFT_645534 [Geopyxis carbonaria]|nr:hypothetical protein EDC01DRAFT_645534 [Geopyxis carbonaria]